MKQGLPCIAVSTLSSWRLRPPPCVGRLHRKTPEIIGEAGAVTHGQVEGRQFVAEFEALHRDFDGAAPFIARQQQRGRQDVDQLLVVGRHLGFALIGEAFPHLAELHSGDRRRRLLILAEADGLAERLRQSADERWLLGLGFALVAFG